jgi:predicted phosphodiesterase
LQGVCTDNENAIFWCFTTKLVKTDRTGKIARQIDGASHHGDLCFYQGQSHLGQHQRRQICVAVNLGKFNDPLGKADSWVYVYDADDLSLIARHPTPEVFHGAGGIAFHDGKFLVVGGLPQDANENYAYEYDAQFKFRRKRVLASGHTHLGIQTAAFAEGQWWFGCYGRPKSVAGPATPPILLKAHPSLTTIERFEFDASLGIVPAGAGRFLVARGGGSKDQGYLGRLVPAVTDKEHGLKLVEK